MTELLYGKAPILEALRAKRRSIYRIFLQRKSHKKSHARDVAFTELQKWARELKIECQEVSPHWFEEKLPQAHHQGWAAEVGPVVVTEEKGWYKNLAKSGTSTILALDQIQDPQNLGAILRTAEACGVAAVMVTEQRSAPLSSAVSRSSAGAVEHLTLVKVKNLSRSLKQLKEIGFWVVGTEGVQEGDWVTEEKASIGTAAKPTQVGSIQNALDFDWPERCVLVLGSEGQGMRRLTLESCDFLIHLPMRGRITSLNVAATATACLYLRQSKAKFS